MLPPDVQKDRETENHTQKPSTKNNEASGLEYTDYQKAIGFCTQNPASLVSNFPLFPSWKQTKPPYQFNVETNTKNSMSKGYEFSVKIA